MAINGKPLNEEHYTLTAESLTIHHVPEHCVVEITNQIHPEKNTALSGFIVLKLYFALNVKRKGFDALLIYPDRPDVMAKFTTTIIAEKIQYPVLLSNGNCVARGSEGTRHWVKWEIPLKNPVIYLPWWQEIWWL